MTLITDEEAKTKWCPFVRHHNAMFQPCGNSMAGAGAGHDRNVQPFFTCIGSACMAWRWVDVVENPNYGNTNKLAPTHGYCGIAGKP